MNTFLMGVLLAVVTTALFDFLYYLPRFRALQAAQEDIEDRYL